MSSGEMEDVWENAPEELSELRAKFTATGVNSHIIWTPTQFYDNLFRPSKPREAIVAALLKERRLGFEATEGQLSGDASLDDNLDFWNALLAPKSTSRSGSRGSGHSDEGELIKKASWTTASFTELPDVTGDHLALNNEGKYTIGDQLTALLPSKNVEAIVATAATTSSDNWIQKLESLLCSFFAALFESSSDSGQALMELMPREALGQVQDIFKLLLATDSKLHAELDAMMVLAEKWLLAWGEDGDTRSKALEFVNAYMTKIKEEGYKKLPVQQRLRKLGAFVAGMNSFDAGDNFDSTPKESQLSALKIIRDLRSAAANKPPSPRVKPASHFARVVASLLCDVPCDAPLRRTQVYAGKGSSTAFPSTFHSDTGFRRFVDARYGAGYSKKDVFRRHRIYKTASAPLTSASKVKNMKCILPIYTKAYRVAIESGDGYCTNGFRQGGKPGKKGEEMMEREFKSELSSRHSYRKKETSSSNKKNRSERSKSRARNNRRTARSSSYDSNETWEHDKYGERTSRKRRKGDTSDEGRRKNKARRDEDSRNNTKKLKSQKSKPVKSRYDSDDEFSQTSKSTKSRSRNDTRKSKNPRKSKSTKIRQYSDEDLRQNKSRSRNDVPKNTRKSRVQPKSENKSKSVKNRYDSEDEMSSRSKSRNDVPRNTRKSRVQPKSENKSKSVKNRYDSEDEMSSRSKSRNDERRSKSREQQKASNSNKQQRKTYTSGDSDEDLSKSRKSKSRTGAGKRKPSNTKKLKGQSSDDDELLKQKRKINNKSIQPQNNKDLQSSTKVQKLENELRQRKSQQQQRLQDQKRQSKSKLEQRLNKPLKAHASDEELEQRRKSRGRDRDREDVKKSKSKASQQFQTSQKLSNSVNKQQINNAQDVNRKIGKNNEIQKDTRRSKEVKNLQNQGSFNKKSIEKGQKNEEEMTENTNDRKSGSEKRDLRNSEGQEERKSTETEGQGNNGRGSQKQNEGRGSGKRDLIESGKIEKRGSDLRKSDKSEKREILLEPAKGDVQSSEMRKSAQDTRRSRNSQRSEKRERKSERQTDKERKSKYSRQSGGKEDDDYLQEAYESMDTETDYENTRSKSAKLKGSTRSKNKLKKNFNTSKSEPKIWSKSKSRNDLKQNDKSFKSYEGLMPKGQTQNSVVNKIKPTYQTFMEGDNALELEFGHQRGMDISSVWKQMQMANGQYSKGGKRDIGCPGSLWGRLPLPRDKMLGQDPPACGILTSPSKSALLQDNLIDFGDFGFEKCKQIFRDEARTKGQPRPSTAEVESKMVERVSRARKNIERETKSAKFLESESEVEEDEIFIGPRPSGMSLKPKKSKKLVRKEAKIQLVTDEALPPIKLPPLTLKNKSPAQGCEPVARCLKMALKLFKTPLRAPAIPLPENLVVHFQKRFPKYDWPIGTPAALRYYPSGQPFCVVFENGAGRVHYPHGGLAVAISAPQHQSPSRVLVVRDPFDQFYFFDKSLLADLDGEGRGSVWDENGNLKKLEYNTFGGYCQVSPSFRQNWQWNSGGQRLVVKLNRYLALKILEFGKIYLVFYGHKRGVRLNVGAGHGLNLMSVANCDEAPKSMQKLPCHTFDYARGQFLTPAGVFGLSDKFDKEGNDKMQTDVEEQNDCYVADCECNCNL